MTSSPPSNSNGDGQSAVFDRLHEGVRRWVWDQGWDRLRPVQESAAGPILDGDKDVIISAPTAGGKTEAAFLPIASRLAESTSAGVGCLCLSPLKALINDQTDRLTPLFERVGLPLTPWHGDVSQSRKQSLLKERRGVLLITPESLEALFVLRGSQVSSLFSGLRYVVVDELHAFIGSARGRQLQSLLNRVELAVRRPIPRIALSATLGDMRLAAEVLRPGSGEAVVLVEGDQDGRELRMQLRGYKLRRSSSTASTSESEDLGDANRLCPDLFEALRGSANLVFANSRRRVEELTDKLTRICAAERVPNEFFAHHGNLSREIREDAEERVKNHSRPTSVICTSTLELGIDIGNVASIAQIGSPPSVASLRQRLGRSGRRGDEAAIMRVYVVEEELDSRAGPLEELRAQLVQSIAMTQLLLGRWCEPPVPSQLHLSTLVQQILSVIAQHGGASARDLYGALCQSGPFRDVDHELFAQLLRCLGDSHILTQTSDGALAVGDRGEKIVDHYSFYAAFATSEEYRLVSGNRPLGTMPITQPLAPGDYLIFAGRRWAVRTVDDSARVIDLAPAEGGRVPMFDGSGYDAHDRVREEMLRMYRSSLVPSYLDSTARQLLAEGRAGFERWGLMNRATVELGTTILLFPWCGDRAQHTLALQLKASGLEAGIEGVAITVRKASLGEVALALKEVDDKVVPVGAQLAKLAKNQQDEKYDWALTPALRCVDYASRRLDEPGARTAARRVLESIATNVA